MHYKNVFFLRNTKFLRFFFQTICKDEFVCYKGECTGSICLAYGLDSCQCERAAGDPATKSCELCCKLPGEDQPCL